MKGDIIYKFLQLFAVLVIMVLMFSTAFGRGIVFSALSSLTMVSPKFIQEDMSVYLTAASLFPGDVKIAYSIKGNYHVSLTAAGSVEVTSTESLFLNPTAYETFIKGSCTVDAKEIDITGVKKLTIEKKNNIVTIN